MVAHEQQLKTTFGLLADIREQSRSHTRLQSEKNPIRSISRERIGVAFRKWEEILEA